MYEYLYHVLFYQNLKICTENFLVCIVWFHSLIPKIIQNFVDFLVLQDMQ